MNALNIVEYTHNLGVQAKVASAQMARASAAVKSRALLALVATLCLALSLASVPARAQSEASAALSLLPVASVVATASVGAAAVSVLPQDRQRLYNAGYRYRRDDPTIGQKAVSQTQLSFVQPLGTNWKVLGLWNYDIKEKESQEALFGISYESCCWQVSLFKRSFLADAALTSNSADRKRDAIFVEITLKGLTGLSSGVGSLFEKNVFGYTQLQHKKEGF